MVFTNAINNQIPNSILAGQGFNSFNISPERRKEITDEELFDILTPAAAIGAGMIASPIGAIPDIALMTARGVGKAASVLPGLGPEFAKGVERTIPEPFVTRNIENALTFGNREKLAQSLGSETPFGIGELMGGIGGPMALAAKAPGLFKAFDVATDIASGTPGASAFLGRATTPLGAVGRGAAVGAAGSLFPAVDVGYNATEGTTNLPGAALTIGAGGLLGGAIPAALTGKQLLDDISQTVKKRLVQSDNTKTMSDITKRRYEAMQAQQMAVQKQMEQMPYENPLAAEEATQIIPKEISSNQMSQDDALAEFELELAGNIKKAVLESQNELTAKLNLQKELQNNIAEFENPTPINFKKVSDEKLFSYGDNIDNAIAKWFGKNPRGKINKESVEFYGGLDNQLLNSTYFKRKPDFKELQKQKKLAQKSETIFAYEGDGVDKAAVQINEMLGGNVDEQMLGERIVDFMKKNPTGNSSYKKQLQDIMKFQTEGEEGQYLPQVQQELDSIVDDITHLQKGIDEADIEINDIMQKPHVVNYLNKKKAQETLAAQKTTPIAETKAETPVIKAETETPIAKPEELTPERIEYDKDAKVNRWKPVVDEVARLSKDVGAMMYNFAVRPGIYKAQLLEQVKPLINVIKKYSGDTAVMKNLANIGRLGYDALPPDLARQLEALQPFFKAQAEAMNKAGMDIDLVNGIYFPRGWSDIKELQTRLGSQKKAYESDSGFLTDEQEVNFENRYLTRELEKSKTIPEVTDDIIDLFDPMQGINNWLDNISEKQAEIDLFGNATGNLKENIINLVSKNIGSFKSKEDAQKAILLMGKAIASRSSKVPNSYKLFSSAASAISFTGSSTLGSQFLDIPLSMARNGLINALDGVATTIATVFPQYKGQMKQILKDAGLQDAVESYMDTGQFESLTGKTAKLFKLAQDKRYSKAFQESLAASGLSLNKFIYIGTRLSDAFNKKAQIVARHRNLQKNPDLVLEDIDRFIPDQKERQLVIDFYKGYKTDKNQRKKPLPAPVIAYLVNTGLKYAAKTRYDRALVSLTGDSIERAANFAYTFNNKFATALRTDLKNLTKEVTTSKNPAKVAKKLLEVAAGAGTVIGATVGLGLYRSGYIGNEEQNMPITGDVLGKTTLEAVGGMAAPYITRAVKTGAAIKESNPMNRFETIANAAFPTSGTLFKTAGSAAQLALQGTPQDIYNPEVNPSYRYMPPRLVTEAVYRQSDKYKESMADKALTAMQQPYAQEKSINDQQVRAQKILMIENDLLGSNLIDNQQKQKLLNETRLLRERQPGTVAYNTALANAEQTISNLRNYGTADLQQVTTNKGNKYIADAEITKREQIARELVREGIVSPQEFAGMMMKYKEMRKGYNIR